MVCPLAPHVSLKPHLGPQWSWPISKPFGTTSDPLGPLVYFLFSFMDSCVLPVLFLYLILLIPPVYILISDPQS